MYVQRRSQRSDSGVLREPENPGGDGRDTLLNDSTNRNRSRSANRQKHDSLAGRHNSLTGRHNSLTGRHNSLTGRHDSQAKLIVTTETDVTRADRRL